MKEIEIRVIKLSNFKFKKEDKMKRIIEGQNSNEMDD